MAKRVKVGHRTVACPPASEQYAPATRVELTTNVNEGELILIDPHNSTETRRLVSGLSQRRQKYAVGSHKQALSIAEKRNGCLAVCIDANSSGQLVSCQRHGVVNLLLSKDAAKHKISYGEQILVGHLHPEWRSTIPSNRNNEPVGEVVAVYYDNPGRGLVSVRVRLTLQ